MIYVLIPSIALVSLIVFLAWRNSRKQNPVAKFYEAGLIDNIKYQDELFEKYNRLVREHNKLLASYQLVKDKKSPAATGRYQRITEKWKAIGQIRQQLAGLGIVVE